ncbi:MAG: hypothetical protein HRU20_26270 [Pseudomonadales bacterium]|nr:hypothetical protein [Pseudomonadales bacterium]
MTTSLNLLLQTLILQTLLLLCTMQVLPAEAGAQERRIEFGDAYIKGQSLKANAAYLLNRRKAQTASLIRIRKNYRAEILQDMEFINTAEKNQLEQRKVPALSLIN